jgi:hypothetical protein
VHAEDLEHFAHHEEIELIEAEREAKFQGISVEEALAQHDHDSQPPPPPRASHKKEPEGEDPAVRFREAKAESEKLGSWGEGEGGFRPPSTSNQKMRCVDVYYARVARARTDTHCRKNLPYKYKFRKAWGDF